MCSSHLYAASVRLNSGGGLNTSDGLHTYIDDTTQIQVRRLNNTGQLYNPNAIPSNTQLDNGIYLRANNGLIGPDHFGFPSTLTPTAYINRTVSTPAPAAVSQGVTQSSTSQFSAPRFSTLVAGPSVTVNWKYTYPLDYITAEVTLVIPLGYPISSSNPVRYYHAVDTYLGGDDRGCGVRYTDTNGRQIVGTYPLSGGTNAPCPSSSSLPANLDVVESFRERNRSFDHYCVGAWDSFWSSSNNACAIAKTNSLSDTISTTKIDTGIAIEYDFILPGTYTFSYDFVVGSTFVPNYDHLEVRHSGTGTLCPVDIKVLACLSSTVPCPDNQLVTTGALTGNLTVSPSTPTVTATPDSTFTIGSDGPIDTVSMTGSAAATYTLGAANLTKAPLSGVKCWNTATNSQSCSFTFTNTPCLSTFECMESGLTYNNLIGGSNLRNPIYTKLAGKGFDLDVYALTSTGAKASGYAGNNVTVELVSETSNSCGAMVAQKTIAFQSSDAGKKTVSFSDAEVAFASPSLRCRVTDTTLNKTGCSSDNFTLRPQSLIVSSTDAEKTLYTNTPVATGSKVFRAASDTFNLTVDGTNVSGYNGTPLIRGDNPLSAHPGAPATGTLAGNFVKNVGNGFTYSEVGHFQFNQYALYDNTFTSVDYANSKGDCDDSTNLYDNVGVGTPKKYGCGVRNTAVSDYIGRFIPHHFSLTAGSTTRACNTFAYFGQDTATVAGVETIFSMRAENGLNAVTQNYTSSYAKFDLNTWGNFNFTAKNYQLDTDAAITASAANPKASGTWSNGIASNVRAKHKIARPATQISPQNVIIYAKPTENDGTKTVDSTKTPISASAPANNPLLRYGRLAIGPAHGSELVQLAVPIETQYWDGARYVRSGGDNCTTIDVKSIAMPTFRGNLSACETFLTATSTANNGLLTAILSAPKNDSNGVPNTGSVDLRINVSAATGTSCQSAAAPISATSSDRNWFGDSPSADPVGRASFGIYKAPIIYMRENF
jgi:MSHA biogenesis protein MshQ